MLKGVFALQSGAILVGVGTMRKLFVTGVTLILALLQGELLSAAAPAPATAQPAAAAPVANSIEKVKDNVYTFSHGLWVSTFVVTDDGIILMDPLNVTAATWFKAEAKKRFNKEVRYLIYSHGHWDHAGGGEVYDKAIAVAQDNMLAENAPEQVKARVPDITYSKHLTIKLGGDSVELFHFGNDHGFAMTYLYHPRTRIMVTVDILAKERLPYKDLPYDDPQATIDTLTALEAMDVDLYIPGHGNIATKDDLRKDRAYWELLRAAVAAQMTNGKTLDEMKPLVLTQLAAYSGWQMYQPWGPENVAAMYRILSKPQTSAR
jgi:glyoxylase-like metal-dependent hydrolase (beta-lactamase superfamily II)